MAGSKSAPGPSQPSNPLANDETQPSKLTKKSCSCAWEDCDEFRSQTLASDDPHVAPWKGRFVKITASTSNKSKALVANTIRHLKAPTGLAEYPIARHHFPLDLCSYQDMTKENWNTPLSKADANRFGIRDNSEKYGTGRRPLRMSHPWKFQ